MKKINLDHSATTPVRAEVAEAMTPYFSDVFGNPSSLHSSGQGARRAIETCRKNVADILDVNADEIIFTSGGTESDNLALKGVAYAEQNKGRHIITSAIEHSAVLNCCRHLEQEGYELTYLPVDEHGVVDLESVISAMRSDTVLISVMLANNEVGTIQPIRKIGKLIGKESILFHTDAVQAAGKIPLRPDELNIDLLSISGHKIYGPKGIWVSTGAACSSGSRDASHVLKAMNVPGNMARGSIRFSLGRQNTEADIRQVLSTLPQIVSRLR